MHDRAHRSPVPAPNRAGGGGRRADRVPSRACCVRIAPRTVLREQRADVIGLDPPRGCHGPSRWLVGNECVAFAAENLHIPVVFDVSNAESALRSLAKFPMRECREALVVGRDDDPRSIGGLLTPL